MQTYRRLTDNDTNLGPITIGARSKTWRPVGVTLESGADEHPGCSVNLYALGWSVRIAVPPIVKPWRCWVDTSRHAWSTGTNGGYWDEHPREYGFRLSDGFLQVFLGAQTHDSTTTQIWCRHLPWTQWRYIGKRWYDLQGNQCESLTQKEERAEKGEWAVGYAKRKAQEDRVPKAVFDVLDYDGEPRRATTSIDEMEWHFGEGWFKWLSLFRKAKVQRSLHIEFDKEVGYEKGSWKGGLMGTGIEMLPGELHEDAFRRFCDKGVRNKGGISALTLVGRVN